jgi:hypothetical protein
MYPTLRLVCVLIILCAVQVGLIFFAGVDIPRFEGAVAINQFPRILQSVVHVVLGVEAVLLCMCAFGGIGELMHRLTTKK